MGSLPNLNELSHDTFVQRANADRDAARERAQNLEFIGRDAKNQRTTTTTAAATTTTTTAAVAIKEQLPLQLQNKLQQHRHSLTSRKVHRTRSSGATHHIVDDHQMTEHMLRYSPISNRNHRVSTTPPFHITTSSTSAATTYATGYLTQSGSSRRRESVNSSVGATSLRRLLTVNRGCRNKIPLHVRAKVAKNVTFLVLSHGLMCAVLIPLFGLQASNSLWFHQESWLLKFTNPNVGPLLLSLCCLSTSGMCLLTMRLIKRIGYIRIIIAHYVIFSLFLLCHLYPTIWLLLPAYFLLGLTLGPSWICKFSLVVLFASRISCGQHECPTTVQMMSENSNSDDHKALCNRNERTRRLARWFHAIQDIGILLGAIIASIIISCATSQSNCLLAQQPIEMSINRTLLNNTHGELITFNDTHKIPSIDVYGSASSQQTIEHGANDKSHIDTTKTIITTTTTTTTKATTITPLVTMNLLDYYKESIFNQRDDLLDSLFNTNEHGIRICGAGSCPTWHDMPNEFNRTDEYNWFTYSGTITLTLFYIVFAIIAIGLSCLSQHGDNTFKYGNSKGITDTILFASPMAYFIGTEQGYVLGGFTRAFVSCTLGVQMVAGALVGMALMQFTVSCTLSMLLRHVKRLAVLAAAFFFQACLFLVLSRWKPSQEDSALFYVIAAAWGACNGIWETMLFALISLNHINNVPQILSPLQAFRFLGLGITFAAHGFICENPKILFLFILLVISIVPYGMLELRLENQRKVQSHSI